MAEFLLELYSEEIPHGLQIDCRTNLDASFQKKLEDHNIKYKHINVFSTPSRLCIHIEGLPTNLISSIKKMFLKKK
jgi:glycyl-tRNA synthetase beta chain